MNKSSKTTKSNKKTISLEEETLKMEQELLKLKEVLDEKRIDVNSKKSKRWNNATKKPLSMIENKFVVDPLTNTKMNPLKILKNHINNENHVPKEHESHNNNNQNNNKNNKENN